MLWLFVAVEAAAIFGVFYWGIRVGRAIERYKQRRQNEVPSPGAVDHHDELLGG